MKTTINCVLAFLSLGWAANVGAQQALAVSASEAGNEVKAKEHFKYLLINSGLSGVCAAVLVKRLMK